MAGRVRRSQRTAGDDASDDEFRYEFVPPQKDDYRTYRALAQKIKNNESIDVRDPETFDLINDYLSALYKRLAAVSPSEVEPFASILAAYDHDDIRSMCITWGQEKLCGLVDERKLNTFICQAGRNHLWRNPQGRVDATYVAPFWAWMISCLPNTMLRYDQTAPMFTMFAGMDPSGELMKATIHSMPFILEAMVVRYPSLKANMPLEKTKYLHITHLLYFLQSQMPVDKRKLHLRDTFELAAPLFPDNAEVASAALQVHSVLPRHWRQINERLGYYMSKDYWLNCVKLGSLSGMVIEEEKYRGSEERLARKGDENRRTMFLVERRPFVTRVSHDATAAAQVVQELPFDIPAGGQGQPDRRTLRHGAAVTRARPR